MAEVEVQNNGSEINLPLPKLHQNNIDAEASQDLKVKKLSNKAILPSRGSPLSAGYDIFSAVEAKVPARGKAMIPTDLSISIPEGTYARMGNLKFLF